MLNSEAKNKLLPQLHNMESKTRWISDLLQLHLDPVGPNATVVSLGCGNCEELLHVRNFSGPDARIIAVDRKKPSTNGLISIEASSTIFLSADYCEVDKITTSIGILPELVIFRNPEIFIYNRRSKEVTVNTLNISAIGRWADILAPSGQLFTTHYTIIERDIVAENLKQTGLNPITAENTLIPNEFWRIKNGEIQIPDGFTTTVRK